MEVVIDLECPFGIILPAQFIVEAVNTYEQTKLDKELLEVIMLKQGEVIKDLVEACQEWVQWFDYVSAYQHENLVNGQTLESASENWQGMVNPPSPDINKMKQALKKAKGAN